MLIFVGIIVFFVSMKFFDFGFTPLSWGVLALISVVLTFALDKVNKDLGYKMWERERDKERERDYREFSKELDHIDRKNERRRKSRNRLL